ncbi:MAG: hypothetical protein LRZ85_09500 [Alphaproteobacteria bacterium]|nr:hypothetical protein [Alphaproteobacteria bacterium]
MTDLLQEVDDMMRQERLAKIWHNHGNFIIGAIVAIILATAAFSGIKSWNAHVRTQQTEKLMAALDENNFTEKAPEIAADLRPGLKTVALLTAAGKHLEEEKPEEALILFKQIAGDKSTPRDLAGFAVIMEARLNKNEGNKQDILAALENIYRSSASPWRFHAALEAAVLKASADNYAGAAMP